MCMIFARTQTCCSAGTQSQSSPSQSSPREPFPPPPKHRSCQGQRAHHGMELRPGPSLRPEDGGVGKEQTYKPLHVLSRGLQSTASYCFNGLSRLAPSIAASFYARSSRQARPLPGIKFHCKQSPSSPSPRQGPSGAPRCSSAPITAPALLGDGEMAMPKSVRGNTGRQPRSRRLAHLPPQPPAHCSLRVLPTKGLLSPSPLPARQRPKCYHGRETPQGKSQGSRGHCAQSRRPYFGAGAEPGLP